MTHQTNQTIPLTGRPVRCSVCSSAPNREGLKCIEHPEDYIRDCNTGPLKNTSEYTEYNGCWKIEQFVLYDGPEPYHLIGNDTTKKRDDMNHHDCKMQETCY